MRGISCLMPSVRGLNIGRGKNESDMNWVLGYANPDGNSSFWGLLSRSPLLLTCTHFPFVPNPSHRYNTLRASLSGLRAQAHSGILLPFHSLAESFPHVFSLKMSH